MINKIKLPNQEKDENKYDEEPECRFKSHWKPLIILRNY